MDGVFIGTVRIGSVCKFAGEPPATRWVAFAPKDQKRKFKTRREAVAWLISQYNETVSTMAAA